MIQNRIKTVIVTGKQVVRVRTGEVGEDAI